MSDGDMALLLARAQFAFTVSFHFIFPAFSIGLASYLAVLEGLWLKTGVPLSPALSLLTENLRHRRCHGSRQSASSRLAASPVDQGGAIAGW